MGGGGYPYPIMLCNITQNSMGQTPGGFPARSSRGGKGRDPARSSRGGNLPGPARGGTLPGPAGRGGTLPGPARGYPAGGYPAGGEGGYPAGGYPARGGTQVGQQKEYSIHGGWYASCVHAGGLSCFNMRMILFVTMPISNLCPDWSH